MANYPHPIIAKEGWPFLAGAVVLAAVVAVFAGWWSLPFWIIALFVLQFFRDPPREVPQAPGIVLAPADGRIVVVGQARDEYLQRDAIKISVFMNVFNVHSNRSPVDGSVENAWYFPGLFVNADLDKASTENERNALHLRTDDGRDVTCVQVAGLIARRILCYVTKGERLARGQRYGFIRFGSRVDVYLPLGSVPKVAIGDVVKATTTVLAQLPPLDASIAAMSTPGYKPRRRIVDPIRKRGIYLLPNLFTTLNLFAGFYAIVQGMNHEFEKAAIAIFVAMVLDSLDGRVARLTRTQSAFGAEYDSLVDMVSFGAAPALVMYEWAFRDMGRLGWIAAFVYCAGAALRLARFNTQLAVADKRWFTGLPSPAAAALVAGMIWVFHGYQVRGPDVNLIAAGLTVYAGITMVSNVKFYSGKDINLRRAVPFWMAIVIVLALLLISIEPSHVLWGVMLAYGLSGYVMWVVARWRSETTYKQYQHIRDALEEGNVSALARMLADTPPDTLVGRGGRTLLLVAVEEANVPAIDALLARGASLELANSQGVTPLAMAAEMGFQEGVETLLVAGANPNALDKAGMTPLDFAEEQGAHDISAILLRYGGKSSRELAPQQAERL